jgi:hypothetical protein
MQLTKLFQKIVFGQSKPIQYTNTQKAKTIYPTEKIEINDFFLNTNKSIKNISLSEQISNWWYLLTTEKQNSLQKHYNTTDINLIYLLEHKTNKIHKNYRPTSIYDKDIQIGSVEVRL